MHLERLPDDLNRYEPHEEEALAEGADIEPDLSQVEEIFDLTDSHCNRKDDKLSQRMNAARYQMKQKGASR